MFVPALNLECCACHCDNVTMQLILLSCSQVKLLIMETLEIQKANWCTMVLFNSEYKLGEITFHKHILMLMTLDEFLASNSHEYPVAIVQQMIVGSHLRSVTDCRLPIEVTDALAGNMFAYLCTY